MKKIKKNPELHTMTSTALITWRDALYYHYVIRNVQLKDMAVLYNRCSITIQRWLRKYKVHKTKEQAQFFTRLYYIKTYGPDVTNCWQLKAVKEKIKKTNLERYGYESARQNEKVIEKSRQTCLQKYGVTNATKTLETRKKMKKTNLERYGVENTFQSEEKKEKIKQTCMKRYGVVNPQQAKEIKLRTKKTSLKKYGVPSPNQNKKVKAKYIKTCLKKYGVINTGQLPEIIEKIRSSKKKNGTFNTSKPEKDIKVLLEAKFPDLEYQYKEKRYPFSCDFYIPSLDLFIEYQGFWSHGFKPFEGTKEDLIQLEKWKSKENNPIYKGAIQVWTIRDPLKRKTARENGLNWIEFFDMDQFMSWYNTI